MYIYQYKVYQNKNEEMKDFITHLLPKRIHCYFPHKKDAPKSCNVDKNQELPYIDINGKNKRKFKILFNHYKKNDYYWRVTILSHIEKIQTIYKNIAKNQSKKIN